MGALGALRFDQRDDIGDGPVIGLGTQRAGMMLVAQVDQIGVDDVSLAVVADLADLAGVEQFGDLAALGAELAG